MAEKIPSITGMNDILPEEATSWRVLETAAHHLFRRYGFGEIRTPLLERTPLFARGIGGDTQVVRKEMYSFEDRAGEALTLRPEGTAGVVRAYIEHALSARGDITKLYYLGPMFRYERPQKGRLRQFHQIGAEILGADSPLADAEGVILVDRLTKAVGVTDYAVEINTLGTVAERVPYLEKLTAYFGTHHDGLCADCRTRLERNPLRIFDCKNPACRELGDKAPLLSDGLGDASRRDFVNFQAELSRAGVAFEVNPRIVRGFDYYEKSTYEFVSVRLGAQNAFAGGGRYNRLVEELGGRSAPGTGFAIGCERLIMLMKEVEGTKADCVPGVYIVALDAESLVLARKLAQEARDAGLAAEAPYEVKSLKSQMRLADKLGYRHAAIIGEAERAQGRAVLKDMRAGTQREAEFSDLIAAVASG